MLVAESTIGLSKNEAIANGSPFRVSPLKTIDDVEAVTFDWVVLVNNNRLHNLLGNIPAEEHERNYYAETNGQSTDKAAKTAA